jgi:translation initiation factor IF-1
MSKEDKSYLTFEAVVTGIQKTFYVLEVPNVEVLAGKTIRATLSGKMRMNKIRVIIGDTVTVELDQYDLTKGRIIYRKK